ncbi:hypothetical protein [Synechococcus sp. UW140]|uniref:hypothetical protein n=1 Tax=Synechococcus sp. UW140 TaxID=368503 RepID=UPI003137A3A8
MTRRKQPRPWLAAGSSYELQQLQQMEDNLRTWGRSQPRPFEEHITPPPNWVLWNY